MSKTTASDITSFQTGGMIENLVDINSVNELKAALEMESPFWILGDGANVVISDKGLPGTTLHIKMDKIEIAEDNLVIADAGVEWDDFVQAAIDKDLWGVELMSGIPGSVGAGVVGNIAAYGQAVADSLAWIEVVDFEDDSPSVKKMAATELGLEYRSSKLATDYNSIIIVRAAFQLSKDKTTELGYENAVLIAKELDLDTETLTHRREIIMTTRERAGSLLDPKHKQRTAGSFFKNPLVTHTQAEEIVQYEERPVTREAILKQNKIHGGDSLRMSAALVLLAAGFERGQAWGPVRLHKDHVLKIENTGGATSQQIYDVAKEIRATVKERFGIELKAEVRFLGDFD